MRIQEIKRLTAKTNPHYFTRETLKYFGQTMKSFSVKKQYDGRFKIKAPAYDHKGVKQEDTIMFYNPTTNELERK